MLWSANAIDTTTKISLRVEGLRGGRGSEMQYEDESLEKKEKEKPVVQRLTIEAVAK